MLGYVVKCKLSNITMMTVTMMALIMSSLDSLIIPIRSSNEIHLLYAAILRGGIIDIVNSTNKISEIYNPNKLRKYYSLFLNALPSTINSCNGNVIKTIGDSLFFYFPNTG